MNINYLYINKIIRLLIYVKKFFYLLMLYDKKAYLTELK